MSLMMLAASRGQEFVIENLTNGVPWVAPATTVMISTISGQGGSGSPSYSNTVTGATWDANYFTSGTGNSGGIFSWSGFRSLLESTVNTVAAGGSGSYQSATILQYPGTYSLSLTSGNTYSNAAAGTARIVNKYGGWDDGGSIGRDGGASLAWDVIVAATTGGTTFLFDTVTSTSIFSATGGTGGAGAVVNASNLTVTPGRAYNVTIPSGGFIQIQYYK